MTTIDVGRALTFGFEDREWLAKMVLGMLVILVGVVFSIFLVGILILFLLDGYIVALARNVAEEQTPELPQWENLGSLFKDGLYVDVAVLIWNIPTLILLVPSVVPFLFVNQADETTAAFLTTIGILGSCALLLYLIFFALIQPIIFWQVADHGTLESAFDLGRIFTILKEHFGPIVLIAVVTLVAQVIALIVGTLLCVVGLLGTEVWALWVQGHLVGQLGRMVRSTAETTESALQEA